MRLVIASDSFLPRWDGVARFLAEIIPTIAKRCSITVIAPEFPGDKPSFPGVELITVPVSFLNVNAYTLPKRCPEIIESQVRQADIVWTHTLGPIGAEAIRMAHTHGVRCIAYLHSIDWELLSYSVPAVGLRGAARYLVKRYCRSLYNKVDLIMLPSSDLVAVLADNGIDRPTAIVPLGVDTSRFVPAQDKAAAKKQAMIPEGSYVIGFCGRIAREKSLPTLYHAFEDQLNAYPDSWLLLVGSGLRKLQYSHHHARYVGGTDNVVPYLQAMDVFVLPSLTETSSLSTMEAMACGVPPITTQVGNLRSYIEDGVNGFFFPANDWESLSWHIEQLRNDALRKRMAQAARKTIVTKRSWSDSVTAVHGALFGRKMTRS